MRSGGRGGLPSYRSDRHRDASAGLRGQRRPEGCQCRSQGCGRHLVEVQRRVEDREHFALEVGEGVGMWEGMDGDFQVFANPVAQPVLGNRIQPPPRDDDEAKRLSEDRGQGEASWFRLFRMAI
jgi:hypothetical protein